MNPAGSPWLRHLRLLLSGRAEPGVHQLLTSARADQVVNAARAAGWRTWLLDGAPDSKDALMSAAVAAFDLPAWFGRNWDALGDALTDVANESAGGLVVWPHATVLADADPDAWAMACEVFVGATRFHREHDWSFAVVCLADHPLGGLHRL